jgi:hypothetical protein
MAWPSRDPSWAAGCWSLFGAEVATEVCTDAEAVGDGALFELTDGPW